MTPVHSVFILVGAFGALAQGCSLPKNIRGSWYSREPADTVTVIDDTNMSGRGRCVELFVVSKANYTVVFRKNDGCYHCVRFYVRTLNILEKVERMRPSVENVCVGIRNHQELITLFKENHEPKNCRSSLEGVWQFSYQNRYRFTGECNNQEALVASCQVPGTQFLIENQKFNITYRQCEGMSNTFDGVVEYSCLGDWYVGRNHFFAAVNTKESRKDEKYRCFLRNREDDLYIGASITAECNVLKSVEESPERYKLYPVKSEVVDPGCTFPSNFTGNWINTANVDAKVVINATHIVERVYPDVGRWLETVYVCRERRGTRFMLARLGTYGCQKDFVCFEFVPRHHNIIRFRKGTNLIVDQFHTVCSWTQFVNNQDWRYDLLIAEQPVPVRCPVAGKFNFSQIGDAPFETRILGGVTETPRPNIYCKENISDFSVCDIDQKEILVDERYCLSVDYAGRPCIGYWKENLKSYLITYDELDAFTKFRCWVYQRADLNRILMSMAIGPFCALNQDWKSYNYTEGAAVALDMREYEREHDQCPMYFDDAINRVLVFVLAEPVIEY
ncbi:unnamed protein product, partial [Cyprideis torosa]